jgi:hypothetical protein
LKALLLSNQSFRARAPLLARNYTSYQKSLAIAAETPAARSADVIAVFLHSVRRCAASGNYINKREFNGTACAVRRRVRSRRRETSFRERVLSFSAPPFKSRRSKPVVSPMTANEEHKRPSLRSVFVTRERCSYREISSRIPLYAVSFGKRYREKRGTLAARTDARDVTRSRKQLAESILRAQKSWPFAAVN